MKHTLKWFTNRIGKRIHRNPVSCPCTTCTDITLKGLVVKNKEHAEYLAMVQYDLDIDYV